MSYSFQIRAASKADAKTQVANQLADVLERQPVHSVDMAHAQATADAFIDVLMDDESKDVVVVVTGSVSWGGDQAPLEYTQASVGVNAWLAPKEVA